MIVDVASYRDGRREEVPDLAAALAQCRVESTQAGPLPPQDVAPDEPAPPFLWLGLVDPTAEEFSDVAQTLHLHRLAVEDAVTGHQRPKIERYGETVFVVLKVLEYFDDTSTVETGEVMLFVGRRFVVTVRRGDSTVLRQVRHEVDSGARPLRRGPKGVLHAVMEHVVAGYTTIDSELEQDVEEVEEQVFSPSRSSDAQRIYSLKREVLEVRRGAFPLVAPLKRLVEDDGADERDEPDGVHHIDDQARLVLRDVLDNLVRTVEHVETYDRLLTDILNAHLAQVSVRQNDDMRKISAWAAIAAVPTLIAGVYGMNFQHMPELSWRFGYPACVLAMVAICVGLYRVFKRSGWL
ncbi:magnesium/cobalt transporter CorA [Kineococcus rhizosphaerae]|uniref:magnesium/cobalt transporter CorA n=1 Tax=Kineococcus rhizosphaerae TaxID=559628 RepID=UPI000D04B28F|nr:magnesium/cobalt transporter CorA [Kineococcus rhizosphaerae]